MAEPVPAVGDVLATMERRERARLSGCVEQKFVGRPRSKSTFTVAKCPSNDPPPAAPTYHELRDGLIVRWIDTAAWSPGGARPAGDAAP